MKNVLTMLLAGGRGERLEPLTRDRAKPAVPFGGIYRIVDFPLSNCINSNLRRVLVLTQYKAASLDRHINLGWRFLCWELGEFVDVIPPQQRIDDHWYQGTADAIYQNIYHIEKEDPELVLVLAGDHIYKMNYAHMIHFHRRKRGDLTIATIPVPLKQGRHFGVLEIDKDQRVVGFQEKPGDPAPMPNDAEMCLASMGIYTFDTRVMYRRLCDDAGRSGSTHDFGKDVIPAMIGTDRVYAFRFVDENRKGALYWRDVGTLDAYYQANMDLVTVDPVLNLYDRNWPIRTYQPQQPPPKFVFAGEGPGARRGEALDSTVSNGCIVSGGSVAHSILAPNVRINSFARVEESILFDGVQVGRYAKIRRAVIDKDVTIPPGVEIGYDLDHDRERFTVSDDGVVVIAKAEAVDRLGMPDAEPAIVGIGLP